MAGWTSDWPDGVSRTDGGVSYKYIQAWEFIAQAWFALRQRHGILSNYVNPAYEALNQYPQPTPIYDRGMVDSVTLNEDGTITIGMSGVDWTHTWVGYSLSGCSNAHIPANYVLIIDPVPNVETLDPLTTVRGAITASTANLTDHTGTLTIGRDTGQSLFPTDSIAAGYLDSLSSLVGRRWYILQSGGWWVSERLPDRPDEQQKWVGDSSVGGKITVAEHMVTVIDGSYLDNELATLSNLPNGTYATLIDHELETSWTDDQWVTTPANQVIYQADDGGIHRDTITHNLGGSILVFASHTGYTPGGAYVIVKTGDKSSPGRKLLPIFQWYTGAAQTDKTHLADDSVGSWPLAAYSVPLSDGDNCNDPPGCHDFPATVKDSSGQVDQFNDCAGSMAGLFLAPKYTKSLRSIQTEILNLCSNFLEYRDYTGADAINNWTPATFMLSVGINAWSSGYSFIDSSTLAITGTPAVDVEYPISCWYTLINADGSLSAGTGTLTSATRLSAGGFSSTTPIPTAVVITLGFTRYKPRHIRYFYPKTGFLPSANDTGEAIDPPRVDFADDGTVIDYTGQWVKRSKSTTYKARSDSGSAFDGSVTPVHGDLATHIGDNATEACIYSDTGASVNIPDSSGSSLLARVPYYDRYFRGKLSINLEATRSGQASGISTGGQNGTNNYALIDAKQHWWEDGIDVVGTLNVQGGTATGGGATNLIDIAHVTDGSTNPLSCWWNSSRFIGFSDPSAYTGFILSISRTVSGVTTTWRVPITSTTSGSGGVTINFDAVTGMAVAAGDTWSIGEPAYEINKWEGRTVSLVDPVSKLTYRALITHSDATTLFFKQVYDLSGSPATITLGAGWSYTIDDRRFGGVWKWDSTGGLDGSGDWIVPTGNDIARKGNGGNPKPFRADQTMNLPTIVKDYGRIMVDDIMDVSMFDEIQTAINAMVATNRTVEWTNKASDSGSHENNYGSTSAYNTSSFSAALGDGQSLFSFDTPEDGIPPRSSGGAYYDGGYMVDFVGDYAYAKASGYSQLFPATIDFYAFSPKIADFCFCSLAAPADGFTPEPPACDNGGGISGSSPCVLVHGESVWTGDSVAGLQYNKWQKLSSADNSATSAYSRSVGNQSPQMVIDPIATLGYIDLTPGLSAGYTVTNQIAVLKWDFTYV